MNELKFTHPLQWPSEQARTPTYEKSINRSYGVALSVAEAIKFLEEEVKELGNVREVCLITDFSDIDKPAKMRRVGHDSAAMLRVKIDNDYFRFGCDRWVNVEQNIYALHLALRNMRNTVAQGIGDIRSALGGYAAGGTAAAVSSGNLASAAATLEDWRLLLGLGPTATLDDAQAVYRRRAKAVSGDQEQMVELNLAMDAATRALS